MEGFMNKMQMTAFENPCRFAFECTHPRYGVRDENLSIVLTVNYGHE